MACAWQEWPAPAEPLPHSLRVHDLVAAAHLPGWGGVGMGMGVVGGRVNAVGLAQGPLAAIEASAERAQGWLRPQPGGGREGGRAGGPSAQALAPSGQASGCAERPRRLCRQAERAEQRSSSKAHLEHILRAQGGHSTA